MFNIISKTWEAKQGIPGSHTMSCDMMLIYLCGVQIYLQKREIIV